jgi:hypothetical protein
MNEFLPGTEPVASVVSAGERDRSGVVKATISNKVAAHTEADAQYDPQLREKSAVAANYAKLRADIADVVARLDPPRPSGAREALAANEAIMSLMPQPVVMLPMPPTNQHMVEFVAQVAQSVAGQAAMARAAQARVSPALVDAAVH